MNRTRNKGSFKPGQSGNPGGRAKGLGTIRDTFQKYSPEALHLYRMAIWGGKVPEEGAPVTDIPVESDVPWPSRLAGANELLNRGYGKPAQTVDVDVNNKRDLTDWSTEELEALALAGSALGIDEAEGGLH